MPARAGRPRAAGWPQTRASPAYAHRRQTRVRSMLDVDATRGVRRTRQPRQRRHGPADRSRVRGGLGPRQRGAQRLGAPPAAGPLFRSGAGRERRTQAAHGRAAAPPNGSDQIRPEPPRIRRERGRIRRGRARSQPRRPAANAVKQVKIWGSGKEAREEESVGVRPPALRRVAQPPRQDAPVPAPRLARSRGVPGSVAPLAGAATRAAAVASSDPSPAPAGERARERGGVAGCGGRQRGKRIRKKEKRRSLGIEPRPGARCRGRGAAGGGGGGVEALKPADP